MHFDTPIQFNCSFILKIQVRIIAASMRWYKTHWHLWQLNRFCAFYSIQISINTQARTRCNRIVSIIIAFLLHRNWNNESFVKLFCASFVLFFIWHLSIFKKVQKIEWNLKGNKVVSRCVFVCGKVPRKKVNWQLSGFLHTEFSSLQTMCPFDRK